ncbi:hypothetical protein CKN80_02625 [Carnobacterium divergens]|uniref:AAA family ATPase n=1 Tax=Carnobacterium divergens TaxID=2748 RepID=UPI001071CB2A|nr:AAA family ATPase [Carnobacterium divergens]TFJ46654.1 hypothetical protein CKN79_02625 [Carnobacterium divergens]TFJ53617.1 hypothetical protein CKN80_02625 [Carnobacterium divergens]
MDILKLELQDFRQFYGNYEINFGVGEQNTTIILGANGNGKTGIFRAVMFAMYGNIELDQDSKGDEKPILVNLEKLEENLEQPVETIVKLTFEHKERPYVIERSVKMIKEGNNQFVTHMGPTNLYTVAASGDFVKITQDPDTFINDILARDIREFFFFDAEKMELLNETKSKRQMSKEVKKGIMKLLQILSLDESEKYLKELIDQELRKITNKAKDSDISKKSNQKIELNEKINLLEGENHNFVIEYQKAQEEITENEKKLSSNEQIRKLQDEKIQKENYLNETRELYQEQKNRIKDLLKTTPSLLALDFLEQRSIQFQELKNTQKDTIPFELIELSLNQNYCQLCTQDIPHDSSSYHRLEEIKASYAFSDITPVVTGIQTTTQKLKRDEAQLKDNMHSYLEKLVKKEEEIDEKESEIRKIDDQIKDKAGLLDDLKQIEKNLSAHKQNAEKINKRIALNELDIQNSTKRIEQLDDEITKLTAKYQDLLIDREIVNKLSLMKDILSKISNEYTSEIIDQLSSEMTKIFRSLLSEKDRATFARVIINEDYEIVVLDALGNNLMREMSMGQGQIFTLAFITTLAKLASKGRSEINFPLFMDTPFGRISGENRDNLIHQIPAITNQWILLLTDTELTRVEQESFSENGKVGKVYELVNEDRRTKIVEKATVNDLKVRG